MAEEIPAKKAGIELNEVLEAWRLLLEAAKRPQTTSNQDKKEVSE